MTKERIVYYRITKVEKFLFDCLDLKENMKCYSFKFSKLLYLVNTELKTAYKLIDSDNYLTMSDECFDYEKIKEKCEEERLDKKFNIYSKEVLYDFHFASDFKNGKSLVKWEFYPDGVYLADDDGFGVKPNNEINLYGVISAEGKIIVPFQPVDETKTETDVLKILTGEL